MKSNILWFIAGILLAGCVTGPKELKEHNLLGVFDSNKGYVQSSEIIRDMATYCDSGLFSVSYKNFDSLEKATISLKNKNMDYYYMYIEVEGTSSDTSKISVYHYMNTSVTRAMATKVEEWVTQGSRQCTQGF
ncbi:hypothetical protein K6U40_02000 [Vibrio fluvialis]|uniref:hypothetical protein n=1 Tax=Vibrio fluvialis TaxID=676 RepID=UPI00140503BC|nr:hypothetical protein [Vibrio fluvialis]EKO3952875.1 hypothetical protein [Vibrio fluvialis]EKO3998905.1 hypothetical protein [Vibrio fluvialis]ELK3677602.1 hypothetical protein [Vibrio fluvialis]ELV8553715.1 hypothetical protein [Vibrio fluvialis]ELX7501825.1 hypothetical protein [Vibrio fluvialis]